jgi:DNA-binding MarR family transcriptional regulator
MASATSARPDTPTRPAPDLVHSVESVDRLRVVMIRIARRIRSRAQGDISPSQLAVLGTIINHGPLTNGQIAEFEHVRASTSSKIVDTLERAGLVERSADPADRRCVQVSVTTAGSTYADDVRAAGRTWLAEQIGGLDSADVEAIEAAIPALERLLNGAPD